jgi:hypothetical protein
MCGYVVGVLLSNFSLKKDYVANHSVDFRAGLKS